MLSSISDRAHSIGKQEISRFTSEYPGIDVGSNIDSQRNPRECGYGKSWLDIKFSLLRISLLPRASFH